MTPKCHQAIAVGTGHTVEAPLGSLLAAFVTDRFERKWSLAVFGTAIGATFIASVSRREEKGSDVNVATHLLIDVLERSVNAAVIISNDSDLKKPIEVARTHVPVGLVNPTRSYPAGALNADPDAGAGGHWWYQLTPADLLGAQLPNRVGAKITKPVGW